MKKKYLMPSMLIAAIGLFSTAQVYESSNFNGLTPGNVSTNFDNSASGQAGYFTFASNTSTGATTATTTTNAGNSNFQIVASGRDASQGLQIVSPNGNQGQRQMTKGDFAPTWATRAAGNNIIETEFWFNTGPTTTSDTNYRFIQFADQGGTSRIAVALQYNTLTRELRGLANATQNGQVGLFGFSLGAGNTPLILNANTWINAGMAYDSSNGALRWVTSAGAGTNSIFTSAANVIPGMSPDQSLILAFPANTATVANTAAANIVFDDIEIRATATNLLLSVEESTASMSSISMFPNPTDGVVNLSTDSASSMSSVSIFDMSGKLMETSTINNSSFSKDISEYRTGIYLLQITMDNGSVQTQKLVRI
jgi:hypothetical protein